MRPTFSQWLGGRYQPSTARKTLRAIVRAQESDDLGGVPEAELRRYTAFLLEHGAEDAFGQEVLAFGLTAPQRRRRPEERQRIRAARSFADEDWRRLCQALSEDRTPPGCVLTVLCAWPRRIHEVLSLSRDAIDTALAKGQFEGTQKGGIELIAPVAGAEGPLSVLSEQMGQLGAFLRRREPTLAVAWFVAPDGDGSFLAGDAAYQACYRHLRKLGEELKLSGDVHPHRIRRTVALQALRVTGDLQLVKGLLGHRSVSSTVRYVDELRLGEVGELQARLSPFRWNS